VEVEASPEQVHQVAEALETESPLRQLSGGTHRIARLLATGLAVYALYWIVGIVQPQIYRVSFLLVALVATFLLYPARRASRGRVTAADWTLVALAVASLVWPIFDFDRFVYRAATPLPIDLVLGAVCLMLVLEATRRTVGWILPATALAFIVYGYFGPWLDRIGLSLFGHRGYALDRLIGTLYMTLEGVFGVPLDVASTYIVLFTIYGALLEFSGAGRFFLEWAMAATSGSRSGAAPGRSVTLAGFFLGMVSGSGVANTVMIGAVAWPMLRRAGYTADTGGAILASAGIGAIIAPPVMGAAAFLIAEFLNISYFQVIAMAILPAVLYYLSILLMIEADSRRMGARAVAIESRSAWQLARRSGFHFLSPLAIAGLMFVGMSAFRAVGWAMLLAVGVSFLTRETALSPRRLLAALEAGGRGVLSITATTATAGIIVGIMTLTGLGLKIAGIIVTLAGGSLVLTVVYGAFAVWLLGLAVPVTASYIIAAVMIAPALTQVGVPDYAAHMFIFYYAVLSEVSPPTALSPFAAAALTGGNPFRTTLLTWKYTLPAFLVPFAFTLTPQGTALLLRGTPAAILMTMASAAVGIVALGIGLGGRLRAEANVFERSLATFAGLSMIYVSAGTNLVGLALLGAAIAIHLARTRTSAGQQP
jgi:TRAP transporter 4TM/12TM fusion protein